MIRRLAVGAIAAAALAAALGCKEVVVPELPITSVSTIDSVSGLEGDTIHMPLVLTNSTGDTVADGGYVWRILDSSVAQLDRRGRLIFGRVGTTTAIVLAGGLTHTVRVSTVARYAIIASGTEYRDFMRWCGLTTRGGLYCLSTWPDATDSLIPLGTPPSPLRTLAVGQGHVCAVDADHHGWCWGLNVVGELGSDAGVGGHGYAFAPIAVQGGLSFRSIDAGANHSCGVTTDGTVYCWGLHSAGLLGDGDSSSSGAHPAPVRVSLPLPADTVVAGGAVSCALLTDRSVWCWGDNGFGETGVGGLTPAFAWAPVHVVNSGTANGLSFAGLSASFANVCGLTTAAAISCWGNNSWGQLGNIGDTTCWYVPGYSTTNCVLTPNHLPGVFKQVGTGGVISYINGGVSCGLTIGGTVLCWGANRSGEVGDGDSTQTSVPTAVRMSAGTPFSAISVGDFHACGLTPDGVAWCWGQWFGPLPRRLPLQK